MLGIRLGMARGRAKMNLFLALCCRGGTVRCLREVRNQVQCVNNFLNMA